MDSDRPVSKQDLLGKLLERSMVMVTLDARREGVDVPGRFRDDPQLRLNLSYRFGLRLDLDEWGVRATLTFGGLPYACRVPWSAIYQIASHATSEQFLFPADVPDDLAAAMKAQQRSAGQAAEPGRGRPRLSVVGGEREDEGEGVTRAAPPEADLPAPVPTDPAGGDGGKGPRRGHLRRIK